MTLQSNDIFIVIVSYVTFIAFLLRGKYAKLCVTKFTRLIRRFDNRQYSHRRECAALSRFSKIQNNRANNTRSWNDDLEHDHDFCRPRCSHYPSDEHACEHARDVARDDAARREFDDGTRHDTRNRAGSAWRFRAQE